MAFLIGLKREIFAECDLSGFLKLIIPHWAPLWHCGGWHKSFDSHHWATADPGVSFPSLCVLDHFFPILIHYCSHSHFSFSFWPFIIISLTFFVVLFIYSQFHTVFSSLLPLAILSPHSHLAICTVPKHIWPPKSNLFDLCQCPSTLSSPVYSESLLKHKHWCTVHTRQHGCTVVKTVLSKQEGAEFYSYAGAFLCVVCIFSLCLCGH